MAVRVLLMLILAASTLIVRAQTALFEKSLDGLYVRVGSESGGGLSVIVTSASGQTSTALPKVIDHVIDASLWNNSRIVLTGTINPLLTASVIDVGSGQVVDNLFANLKLAVSPDGRRIAFDAGRSLAQSQSAVIQLYDVSRTPEANRMSTAHSQFDGFGGSGLVVYPTWNRINQSDTPDPTLDSEHTLRSMLTWISNDTLVFFEYSTGTLRAVLIEAGDIAHPNIRTANVDVSPLISERGRRDFPDVPLARLPDVRSIVPLSIGPSVARIKVILLPKYWLTTTEFEIEL